MYRDSVRAICLCSMGRTSIKLDDLGAARAAFEQAIAHIRGRDRADDVTLLELARALAGAGREGPARRMLDRSGRRNSAEVRRIGPWPDP